jgi:hypothetical protein
LFDLGEVELLRSLAHSTGMLSWLAVLYKEVDSPLRSWMIHAIDCTTVKSVEPTRDPDYCISLRIAGSAMKIAGIGVSHNLLLRMDLRSAVLYGTRLAC